MSFAHQWWIGQGVSAWRLDLPGNDRLLSFNGGVLCAAPCNYDMTFIKRFGGWGQLQYYWTEEIYTNLNAGFDKALGFNHGHGCLFAVLEYFRTALHYANPLGYDPINSRLESQRHPVVSAGLGGQVRPAVCLYAGQLLPDTTTALRILVAAQPPVQAITTACLPTPGTCSKLTNIDLIKPTGYDPCGLFLCCCRRELVQL